VGCRARLGQTVSLVDLNAESIKELFSNGRGERLPPAHCDPNR